MNQKEKWAYEASKHVDFMEIERIEYAYRAGWVAGFDFAKKLSKEFDPNIAQLGEEEEANE